MDSSVTDVDVAVLMFPIPFVVAAAVTVAAVWRGVIADAKTS